MDSQNMKILRYMKEHSHGITSMEAFEKFGITRLSGRIFELKHNGYKIDSLMEEGINRDGNKTWYARYILKDQEEDYEQY